MKLKVFGSIDVKTARVDNKPVIYKIGNIKNKSKDIDKEVKEAASLSEYATEYLDKKFGRE